MRADRVLIVDDDEELRRLLGDRLRARGMDVREACGGRAALESIAAGGLDLVDHTIKLCNHRK